VALNRTTADAALKEDYQPSIREQLNNEIMMLNQIESNSTDVEGRRAVLSLHTGRNAGTGARAEGGTLPTAGNQAYQEERVSLKYNYGRIKVSGPVIRAMKSDTGSFVRAIESEVNGIVTDLKRDVNRQIFNDANGTIAQCASVSTDTITLTNPTATQLRQLEVGSRVDVGTVTSPTDHGNGLVIESVDRAAGTVTFTTNPTAGVGTSDFIFRSGAKSTTSGATYELTGLQAIVNDSGTLFNVDPSSVAIWTSTVNSNSGTARAATDNLFETVIDDIFLESGKAPDFIVTSPGVRRNYAAQLKAQKRFADTTELKGGFSALSVDAGNVSLPLAIDRDAPTGTAFLIHKAAVTQHQNSDWEFMDEDGSVLSRVSGEDAYEAVLFKYHELTTDQRNVHGRIDDLIES
jgi:hypothetical protein